MTRRFSTLALLLLAFAALPACATSKATRGSRAYNVTTPGSEIVTGPSTQQFRYYPQLQIYYAPSQGLYYWRGPKGWTKGKRVPDWISLENERSVVVFVAADEPYRDHSRIAQVHPPKPVRRPARSPQPPTPTGSDTPGR